MFQWKTNLFPQRPSPPSYQQQKQDLEQTPTDIINNLFTESKDKAQQENSLSHIQDLQKFVLNHQSTIKNMNGLTNQVEQLNNYSEQLLEMSQSVRQQVSNSMNLY